MLTEVENFLIKIGPLNFSWGNSNVGSIIEELYCNDIKISNAINWIEWDDDAVQMHLCEGCGVVGCSSDNYALWRKCGDFFILAPSTDGKYLSYFEKSGLILFTQECYKSLQQKTGFPILDELPDLKACEVLYSLKISAPGDVMGKNFHNNHISLEFKNIMITNYRDDAFAKEQLSQIIDDLKSTEKVLLKKMPTNAETIDFFIDSVYFFEWPILAIINGEWRLSLGHKYYLEVT